MAPRYGPRECSAQVLSNYVQCSVAFPRSTFESNYFNLIQDAHLLTVSCFCGVYLVRVNFS